MKEPPELETVEELQAKIRELQEKTVVAERREAAGVAAEMVEVPIADVLLKRDEYTEINVRNVTPAHALMLVAEHHSSAKGNPIVAINPKGKTMMDPVSERGRLATFFGADKVMAQFPGAVPVFPTSFRQAMDIGMGTRLPRANMLDFNVK